MHASEPVTNEQRRDSARASIHKDLVEIPPERRHDSGIAPRPLGILLALVVAILGSFVLGAGYGAFIALCGEKLVNIAVACSFPFWMNIPAQVGFSLGHLREPKWRLLIGWTGFATCLYAVCVGWLAAVLDGPGFVFDPISLLGQLSSVSNHGVWAIPMEQELTPLAPYMLSLRFGELLWLFVGGAGSLSGALYYPYCQKCDRWMYDEVTLRLRYDPESTDEAQVLASDLVAERYQALFDLDQPIGPKEKGLQVSVYRCEGCGQQHVLNVRWFRSTPDPEMDETQRLLESATGTQLVSGLRVPAEIQAHIAELAQTKAA